MSKENYTLAQPLPEEKREILKVEVLNPDMDKPYEILGLTLERSNEIGDVLKTAMMADPEKADTVSTLKALSEECRNTNELVFACYTCGAMIEKFRSNPVMGLLMALKSASKTKG